MADGRSEQVKRLFEAALKMEPAGRAGLLKGLAELDPSLRQEVESLIASHEKEDSFLEKPPIEHGELLSLDTAAVTHQRSDETEPKNRRQIGPYRILRDVGQGGMGVVYEAEQERPVRRKVALKLIKWGMDTKAVVARFESERQALALMNHPNIASVYDAGATNEGRPFFAMEYVQGILITEYCDKHRLTIKERLELFIQVCDGVQHAHQKGIIHRDIKPSNVLVAVQDDKPVPKIIDFGVAKATSQRLTEHTVATELGQLIGTPEYMSPEQAEMTNLDIDTRTDVYSLGVLLYELLVGAQPFDAKELRVAGLAEIQRKLREDEPPRPSARLSGLGEASTTMATNRRTEVRTLQRQLKWDLDWITMKALEKDRTRRYDTTNALALDVERYLNSEPIRARAPSTVYRVGRFVRRHRAGVAGGVGFAAMLVGVVIATLVQSARIAAERDRAEQEVAKASAINEFLQDTLGSMDASGSFDREITVARALDEAVKKIDAAFEGQPEIKAAVEVTIAKSYSALGRYDEAEELLLSALKTRKRRLGDEHLDVAEALYELGNVRGGRLAGDDDFFQAQENLREALSIRRKLLGQESLEVAEVLASLGSILFSKGDPADEDEVEKLYGESLRIHREILGNDDWRVAQSVRMFAGALSQRDAFEEAERLYLESLDIARRVDADTIVTLNNLAYLYRRMNKHDLSVRYLREALAEFREVYGDDHPDTPLYMMNLGSMLNSAGDFAAAEELAREGVARWQSLYPSGHVSTGMALAVLATSLSGQGKYHASVSIYRQALAVFREHGASQSRISGRQRQLGITLMKLGRYEASETELLAALQSYVETYPDRNHHPRVIEMLTNLVELYEAWGKPEKAAEYRAMLTEPEEPKK